MQQKNWEHGHFTIHEFEELGSTNSYAFEMASAHQIFDHEVILANSQNSGKGRKDRDWISPKGNLYFSVVLKANIPSNQAFQISFLGITALHLAISKLEQKDSHNVIQSKWPNDLLINGKKVAGILLESKIDNNNCEFVVAGIGLNVDSNPENTLFPATNLKECNIDVSPQQIVKNILDEFEALYQNWLSFGFAGIRKLWLQNPYRLGEEINVAFDEKTLCGIFQGLDVDGNLLLKTDDAVMTITTADIL